MTVVAGEFGLKVSHLYGGRRTKTISVARNIAMWLVKKHAKLSGPEIAQLFQKDHSSVVSAISRVEQMLEDPEDREMVLYLDSVVAGGPSRKDHEEE